MAKQTPKKRKPLKRKQAKPARSPKKSARASFRPLRDDKGRFKAKTTAQPKRKASKQVSLTRKPRKTTKKTGSSPVRASNKLIRPGKPNGKQTFKAKTARPPEYEVTSNTERLVTIHTELRKRAIEESRLLVPDSRVRRVEDVYGRKSLKKEVYIGKFLAESTLEQILYETQQGLATLERVAERKPNVRYVACFNLTEYGIKLYGSNKGVIARVDGLRSEALHLSRWGVTAGSPEHVMEGLRGGLDSFLDRKVSTTVCIESVMLSALYGEQGKESGND